MGIMLVEDQHDSECTQQLELEGEAEEPEAAEGQQARGWTASRISSITCGGLEQAARECCWKLGPDYTPIARIRCAEADIHFGADRDR